MNQPSSSWGRRCISHRSLSRRQFAPAPPVPAGVRAGRPGHRPGGAGSVGAPDAGRRHPARPGQQPQHQGGRLSRAAAKADLLAAYGAFDPALNLGRSYTQTYSASFASTGTGFIPITTFIQADNYSLSVGGLMPWGLQYSLGGSSQNQRGAYNGFTDNFLTFGGLRSRSRCCAVSASPEAQPISVCG